MAATQYQIFCKYLNEDINKIVNNSSEKEWISAQTWYQSKVAYNVEDATASNAMLLVVDSVNTKKKAGATYRSVYEDLKKKMQKIDPDTDEELDGPRLRYDDLSVEEKRAYDLCSKYLDIVDKVANDKCVIEYAMIRPIDELRPVPPVQTISNEKTDYHHGGKTQVSSGIRYNPTTEKELLANAKLLDSDLSKIIYEQIASSNNEKYNMLFTFAGMAKTDEQLDGWINNRGICTVSNYRYLSDDKVYEYSAPLWHGAARPGEPPKIGNAPVKSFNAPATVPANSNNTPITLENITFPGTVQEIPTAVYENMERLTVQPWFLITTCNSLRAAMIKVEQLIDIYGKDAVKLGKVVSLEQYIETV